jgi:cis-2,3-dihydrobiphenyl-2,3-diol dehydrogenase
MGRLEGQVALVTGGASGLGRAVVERFVREGARVVLLDRSEASAAATVDAIGPRVSAVVGDVRSGEDNARAVAACLERFGGLDCAVGNAGIWDYNLPLVDLPADRLAESFQELFDVNVLGYLQLAKAALEPLARSQGSMVFTVSNAGFLPNGGGPLYTASKHAVVGLIRQLAFELAPRVRVNGVAPGAIATSLKGPETLGMSERRFPGDRLAERAESFVPIGRLPTPAEYAGAYVFFASREDNVPATGTVLNHDGGFGVRGLGSALRGGDDLMDRLDAQRETE